MLILLLRTTSDWPQANNSQSGVVLFIGLWLENNQSREDVQGCKGRPLIGFEPTTANQGLHLEKDDDVMWNQG